MSVALHTNAEGRPLSAVIAGVESRLRNMKLPAGDTPSQGGEGEESQEVFGDMFAAMGIALLLMDFVLVLQFESFAPMGRAIIGGVVNSTLLTLLVIPAIYELMDKGGSARCG